MKKFSSIAAAVLPLVFAFGASAAEYELLNVSYDPTRELYQDLNKSFTAWYEKKTGDVVTISQSHGGSGAQARSVIDGSPADVVTLALPWDIENIQKQAKLLPENWQTLKPNESSPFNSTIVFLVRKGNPQNIKDWDDLAKPGIKVITPNPKTSGGARYNYAGILAYAKEKFGGDAAKTRDFVKAIYANVPVLDTRARGATNTFVKRRIGDVIIAWENEAYLAVKRFGADTFEIVTPSVSVLAKPPVAVVEKNAKEHGTEKVANDYIDWLYTDDAQKIAAENFYRPTSDAVKKEYEGKFGNIKLVDINDLGGFDKLQKEVWADGGEFDKILKEINSARDN